MSQIDFVCPRMLPNDLLPQNALLNSFIIFFNFDISDKAWTNIRPDTNEELPENERWTVRK